MLFHLIFISLYSLSLSYEPNCGDGCSGFVTNGGRCDIYGCKNGTYCCSELFDYGRCCNYCNERPPPVPPACTQPAGIDCTFYTDCLNRYRVCDVVTNIAYPKCLEYMGVEKDMTPQGVAWSNSVRKCIQVSLGKMLTKTGTLFDCNTLYNEFFEEHPPCYLAPLPDLPNGLCSLPITDIARILYHAKDILMTTQYQPIKSTAIVAGWCSLQWSPAILKAVQAAIVLIKRQINFRLFALGWIADIIVQSLQTDVNAISDVNTTSIFMVYQVLNYTGPYSVPLVDLTDEIAVKLLNEAIKNVTSIDGGVIEYNNVTYIQYT